MFAGRRDWCVDGRRLKLGSSRADGLRPTHARSLRAQVKISSNLYETILPMVKAQVESQISQVPALEPLTVGGGRLPLTHLLSRSQRSGT